MRMSLVLLSEEDASIIPAEQLESMVSFFSVASSALLLLIVVGAGASPRTVSYLIGSLSACNIQPLNIQSYH